MDNQDPIDEYSDDQPRDERGRWTSGGGGGGGGASKPRGPIDSQGMAAKLGLGPRQEKPQQFDEKGKAMREAERERDAQAADDAYERARVRSQGVSDFIKRYNAGKW